MGHHQGSEGLETQHLGCRIDPYLAITAWLASSAMLSC